MLDKNEFQGEENVIFDFKFYRNEIIFQSIKKSFSSLLAKKENLNLSRANE
jgi:hypothetical protein